MGYKYASDRIKLMSIWMLGENTNTEVQIKLCKQLKLNVAESHIVIRKILSQFDASESRIRFVLSPSFLV